MSGVRARTADSREVDLSILKILAWVGILGFIAYFLGQCAISVEEAKVPRNDAPQLGIVGEQESEEDKQK